MVRGLFIVLEGIDGAGKTTQAELLLEHLRKMGRRVHRTAEPTSLPSGVELRRALRGEIKKTEKEMAEMFVADRIAHNLDKENGIKALTESGVDVVCDRYYYSTLAYQGHSTDYEWVRSMNLDCPDIMKPDICIYLDLTPKQSLERITKGRDSVEIYENEETLSAVRSAFMRVFEDIGKRDNIKIINAYRTVDEVSEDIRSEIDKICK